MKTIKFEIVKEIEPSGKVWFHVRMNGSHQTANRSYEEAKRSLETCKTNVVKWGYEKYEEVIFSELVDT
jgi:hypothetical protein